MSESVEAVPMAGHSQEARNSAVRAVLKGLEDLNAVVFFEKSLTSSDASGSGRVVIPKAIAEQYFPRLEQANGIPVNATDTRGRTYTFKFRFWINNQSRMYLLEGAGELHRAFEMSVGDVMVFAQKPDGELIMAGRPATKSDVIKKPPIKRPAAPKEGGSGKRDGGGGGGVGGSGGGGGGGGGAAGKPRPRTGDGRGSRDAERVRDRKRAKAASGGLSVGPAETEPSVDGIFRAVPNGLCGQPGGVSSGKNGRWVVTLNLAGELYRAFFDTQDDAQEAFNAAGQVVAPPA